jgi:hypothetical protein
MPLRGGKKQGESFVNTCPVKGTFDQTGGTHDPIRFQIIPKVREVERLVQNYVTFPRNRRIRILEWGSGTGKWADGFKTYDLFGRHEEFAAFHARK